MEREKEMKLEGLLTKPVQELTTEELEQRHHLLKKLRVLPEKKPKTSKAKGVRSNKDRRVEDAISKLTPEKLERLKKLLG